MKYLLYDYFLKINFNDLGTSGANYIDRVRTLILNEIKIDREPKPINFFLLIGGIVYIPCQILCEQGLDLIDLQLTWREMDNLNCEDFWRHFEEFW